MCRSPPGLQLLTIGFGVVDTSARRRHQAAARGPTRAVDDGPRRLRGVGAASESAGAAAAVLAGRAPRTPCVAPARALDPLPGVSVCAGGRVPQARADARRAHDGRAPGLRRDGMVWTRSTRRARSGNVLGAGVPWRQPRGGGCCIPRSRGPSTWFVDSVVLRRVNYDLLRARIARQLGEAGTAAAALDVACQAIGPALSATTVRWQETSPQTDTEGLAIVDVPSRGISAERRRSHDRSASILDSRARSARRPAAAVRRRRDAGVDGPAARAPRGRHPHREGTP